MTEARAATPEERLKQLQSRVEVAIKLLPDLIESPGTEAATVVRSMFSDVHNSIGMPGNNSPSAEILQESQSQRSTALQIPELLEQILRHLPMLDLLHCQSVCRHWKDVIDSSPILQRALYFRPGKEHRDVGRTIYRRGVNVFNPLLQEVFLEWFTASCYRHGNRRRDNESVAYIPMQRDNPEIFRRPEASWRRMRFQQVSRAETTLVCYKKSAGPYPYEYISVSNDYTMGQVYDLVSRLTTIPRGDDLHWLFFLRPGSDQRPSFGPQDEELVQKLWMERQFWCEKIFGMADNTKLSVDERQIRDSWLERHPRVTRREVEWVHRNYRKSTSLFRWYTILA